MANLYILKCVSITSGRTYGDSALLLLIVSLLIEIIMKTFDDTNRSGNPQPPVPDDPLRDISDNEEAQLFDNGPDAPSERLSNGAVKGSAWLLGIVGVFAVALLVAWLIGMHDSPLSSRSDARQLAALSSGQAPLNPALSSRCVQSPGQFVAILVPSGSVKASGETRQKAEKGYENSGKVESNASSASSTGGGASAASADEDRIEKEAREVIQGDFGDNPGRKLKLGGDYAAVQARVNEILHK